MTNGERIAVLGAGLMGHGIAQVFACAGHPVVIADEDAQVLATVHERVRANLRRLGEDELAAERIELCNTVELAVEKADVVFEAVAEDLAVKRRVFELASQFASDHALLATNTSVISIGEITSVARDPGRALGTHWWNPPFLIPLVEVTPATATRADAVERMMDLLSRAGKSPVHIHRDIPGFVGNRLQHALWREAFALVDEGVCDAESVDRIVKESFGLRLAVLGPMENADLVGLDMAEAIHEYLLPHLSRIDGPVPLLRSLVARGELGMKTGSGFRHWTADEIDATRERLFDHLMASTQTARHRAIP